MKRLIFDVSSNKCGFCEFSWFVSYSSIFFQMPTTCCSAMQFINHQFILHPKCITVLIWCQTSVAKGCFFVIQWSYQFSYQNMRSYIEEAGILCQYLLPIFTGANYLWLISESCPKNLFFPYFSWFFTVITTYFCQITKKLF